MLSFCLSTIAVKVARVTTTHVREAVDIVVRSKKMLTGSSRRGCAYVYDKLYRNRGGALLCSTGTIGVPRAPFALVACSASSS